MSKILIVDDDADILIVASTLLKMHGFQVETINNGGQSIEKVEKYRPDLVLLDINLGNEDGRKICRKIKNNKNNIDLPVILFSANYEYAMSYRECKANGFIAKPFENFDFIKTLKSFL